jgi:hypothetical protein
LHVIHVILYNTHKEPKFPSGKVLISYLIRMIIKFSCAVPDIDQLILLLSIPEMWNLERNIMGFDFRNVFIKISSGSESNEKKETKAGCTYSSKGSQPLHHLESFLLVMSMECITS